VVSLDNKDKTTYTDELKFGFPYRSIYYQYKINRKGEMKGHVDLGSVTVANTKADVYFQLKSKNISLSPIWCRLGAFYFGKTAQCGLRLERNFEGSYFTAFRNVGTFGNLQAAFVGICKLDKSEFGLTKFDSLLNYKLGDANLSLSYNADSTTNPTVTFGLGKLQAGASYNYNKDLSFALNAVTKSTGDQNKFRLVLGAQAKVNKDLVVKAKVDQKAKLTSTLQYTIDDRLSLVTSAQLNFAGQAIDLNKMIPLPIGYQLNFNV